MSCSLLSTTVEDFMNKHGANVETLLRPRPSMAGGNVYGGFECQFQGRPRCRSYCHPAAFTSKCGSHINMLDAYGASRECGHCNRY